MILSERVLIIEDGSALADRIAASPQSADMILSRSATYDQLVELFKTERYDVIIADIDSTLVSGTEIITLMAALTTAPRLVFVTDTPLTHGDTLSDLALAYSVNLIGIVGKPLSANDLAVLLPANSKGLTLDDGGVLTETGFIRGVMGDELTAIFQPRLDFSSGKVSRAEVFARWRTQSGGILGASAIVELAARRGYIAMLTQRMIELALSAHKDWQAKGYTLSVGVNIATESLRSPNFVDDIIGLVEQYDAAPDMLRLEINRIEMHRSPAKPMDSLRRLKEHGFGLTYNDFSRNFASLIRFDEMVFDDFLINRPFMRRAVSLPHARVVLKSLIDMAKNIGVSATCEGIESADQLALAKELGADLGQGFEIGRPMTANALADWIVDYQ